MIHANETTDSPIHPDMIRSIAASYSKTLDKVQEDAIGAAALIGFYYPPEVSAMLESGDPSPVQVVQKLSELMRYLDLVEQGRQIQDPTEEILLHTAFYEAAVRDAATKLVAQVNAVDQGSDRLIQRMRAEYASLDALQTVGLLNKKLPDIKGPPMS